MPQFFIKESEQSAWQYRTYQEPSGQDDVVLFNNTFESLTLTGINAPGVKQLLLINRGTYPVNLAAASSEVGAADRFNTASVIPAGGSARIVYGSLGWDPISDDEPAEKYVTVRAATTANITIATALNNGDTLDGVTLATGDLVLVKNQSSASQNGIYVVGASPVRAPDYDAFDEYPGTIVAVQEGTAGADTLWLCTANRGGTLGSTSIDFAAFGTAETAASLGALINGAGAATLADPDLVPVVQSSVTKKTTFTAIKAFLKTYFDTLYDAAGAAAAVLASVTTELASKVPTTRTVNGNALSGDITLDKDDVGLGNVDNTSDANKPVSTAQQAALDAKQGNTRTVVEDANATVSPTIADTGKTYRCTNATATFALPTTGLTTGLNFWVVFASAGGTIDAGTGKVVEYMKFEGGGFNSGVTQTATGWLERTFIFIEYTDTDTWTTSNFVIVA